MLVEHPVDSPWMREWIKKHRKFEECVVEAYKQYNELKPAKKWLNGGIVTGEPCEIKFGGLCAVCRKPLGFEVSRGEVVIHNKCAESFKRPLRDQVAEDILIIDEGAPFNMSHLEEILQNINERRSR